MLRILLGLVNNPRLLLPMVVLKLENVRWLSALVASKRRSMLLRSVTRKVRPSDPFRLNWVGPVMVSRPALPHWPAAGSTKARLSAEALTGNPVASARRLPVMPVPVVVERTPPTVAVSGIPLPALMALVGVQSFSKAPFHPWISMPPPRPTAVLYCQFRFNTLGRLVLERARSAEVSRKFCACTALSMALEWV